MGDVYEPGPCPKCGGTRQFHYCGGGFDCFWRYRNHPPYHNDGEGFHVHCGRCHFEDLQQIPRNPEGKSDE